MEDLHIEHFNCPNCGGMMQYNIEKEKFICTACGSESTIDEGISSQIKEHDFSQYRAREQAAIPFEGMKSVICQNCGAEVVFDEKDTAALCPMCGSSHVAADKQKSGIPPEGIIPFKIDVYDAGQLFHKWVKSLWFAPNALKNKYQEGDLSGVYIPFWTFDTDAVGRYQGKGGRIRHVRQRDGKVTTTIDWYPVSGMVAMSFDDIQICASRREGASMIQKVEPYNTIHQLKPYLPAYLSGYKAEHYTVRADEGFEQAKQEVRQELTRKAEQQILSRGFNQAQVSSLQMTCSNVTYKHVLLPVYTSFFGYGSKQYNYVINGETGKISGERPYSPIKITLAVLAVIAVIALLMFYSDGGSSSYGLIESLLAII